MTNMSFNPNIQSSSKPWAEVLEDNVLDPEHRVNELEDGGHEGRLEPSDLHELKMRNLEYWELLRLHKDIWRQK
ncbi:hypothetical protein V6N13_147604 [Hibiscus sabdariffa]